MGASSLLGSALAEAAAETVAKPVAAAAEKNLVLKVAAERMADAGVFFST